MATILCVDDDPAVLKTYEKILDRSDHRVIGVNNAAAGLTVLARGDVDLVISDHLMPEMTGLELVTRLRRDGLELPVILVTGHGSIDNAVSAMKAGATDYITKPIDIRELEIATEQALELGRLKQENRRLKEEVQELRRERTIVGESAALKRVLSLVRAVASTRSTILIEGESGTGKELVARAIHNSGDRSERSFISVNCAALPETLIESTLFGHEKGAFTGATRQVKGAFERADGGTLLLDEVSEMRLDLQAKLLRVIQEREFERVGGSAPVRVDVRLLATTNRDLKEAVKEGDFREDLYYRLAVVPITVPPLRERKEDIPALVDRFLRESARDTGRPVERITPQAMDRLMDHDWPGNVRELLHAIERAVVLSTSPVIGPEAFSLGGGPSRMEPQVDTLNLQEMEGVLIERALERTGNNRTRAAGLLGISVRTLRNKLNG